MNPRERMLRLLTLLQTGQRWPARDLAAELRVAPRTLRRDLDQLRELGYPVVGARGPGGAYRLVAGRALPPLMLDEDEAVAAVLGLRLTASGAAGAGIDTGSAHRAADKIRRILPARVAGRADALLGTIDLPDPTDPGPGTLPLLPLAAAITERHRVAFDYRGRDGTARREVEPARLAHQNHRWYLYAWDTDRADWRTFRLDRIVDDPVPVGRSTLRDSPVRDLAAHLRDHPRDGPEHHVTLTLHAGVVAAASALHRTDGELVPLAPDRCRYVAHVDSYQWLALVLLLTDLDFTVEDPPAFRDHLARQASRLLAGAGSGSGAGAGDRTT